MTTPLERIARWADELSANTEWQRQLNEAFDRIGFTAEYVDALSTPGSTGSRAPKAVKDNVWGMIELDPTILFVLDSPILQRLRWLHQLGFSYLTYPSATHSRFEHSVGALYVTERILESFRRAEAAEKRAGPRSPLVSAFSYAIDSEQTALVRLAALLHDVGHGPFSHAGENYFSTHENTTFIGPFTVREFRSLFRKKFYLHDVGGKQKQLSELVSAAIVTSQRFQCLLKHAPHVRDLGGNGKGFARVVSHKIATLILGERIDATDHALPAIVSGPFDADKIDYMIRDAKACGIGISIDVSRIFLRAAAYEAKSPEAFSPECRDELASASVATKVFVLDQVGAEGLNELGAARASLYSRVYFHQLTLNAEAHFIAMLEEARKADQTTTSPSTQFLSSWTLNDACLLDLMRRHDSGQVSQLAFSLSNRFFLKRAACFSADLLGSHASIYTENQRAWVQEVEKGRQHVFRELARQLNAPIEHQNLSNQIQQECGNLRSLLLAEKWVSNELPAAEKPAFVRFISPREPKEVLLPKALTMTASAVIELTEDRGATYQDSGKLGRRRGYLLVPEEWREIALLAFQRVLFRTFVYAESPDLTTLVDPPNSATQVPVPNGLTAHTIFYHPILDLREAANASQLDAAQALKFQLRIENAYAAFPHLVRVEPDQSYEAFGRKFQNFQGEGGWKITPSRGSCREVEGFIAQFPPTSATTQKTFSAK